MQIINFGSINVDRTYRVERFPVRLYRPLLSGDPHAVPRPKAALRHDGLRMGTHDGRLHTDGRAGDHRIHLL